MDHNFVPPLRAMRRTTIQYEELAPICPQPEPLITFGIYEAAAERVPVPCPYCDAPGPHQHVVDRRRFPIRTISGFEFMCEYCHCFFWTTPLGDERVVAKAGVYFIECCDFIKIGISNDVSERWRSLLSQNPHQIVPIGFLPSRDMEALERVLHRQFRHLHHRDEWYKAKYDLRAWIREHALRPELFFAPNRNWNHGGRV